VYQARHAFDVQAPFIVASEGLVCGARRFRRGEAFPWRVLGVSELDLLTLWSALQIDASPAPTALPAVPVQPGLVPAAGLEPAGEAIVEMGAVIAPGGEKRPTVATPEQQRTKHKRR